MINSELHQSGLDYEEGFDYDLYRMKRHVESPSINIKGAFSQETLDESLKGIKDGSVVIS